MTDLVTKTYDQLPLAVDAPADALIGIQQPGGPMQAVKFTLVLGAVADASAAPVRTVAGKLGDVVLVKGDVGLGAVDDTSDTDKPVSTAVQTALDGKAGTAVATEAANGLLSWADKTKLDGVAPGAAVKTVAGRNGDVVLAKGDVGLGDVDDTSDANKPVSTAVQAALDGKASTAIATDLANGLLSAADKTKLDGVAPGAAVKTVAGRNGDVELAKGDVGLGSVDNTSDANKPVSTAAAEAIDAKVDRFPANPYSSLIATVDVLWAQWKAIWWDAANARLHKTDGSGDASNGRINDALALPSFWQMAEGANTIYERWHYCQAVGNAAGVAEAQTMIAQQWAYIKSVFSADQLKLGYHVVQNISDDACWQGGYLRQAHEVTGDALALAYLVEQVPGTLNLYHDPLQAQTDYGYTTPGGIAFKADPFGILYATAGDTVGIQTYGYISTSFEAMLAAAAAYVYQVDNSKTAYRQYALDRAAWLRANMKTPAPADATRCAQGLYFLGWNNDPDVAAANAKTGYAQPLEAYHTPLNAYFGAPIRGLSSLYDGATIAMAALESRLYQITGDAVHLAEVNSICAAFGQPNGFGRTNRGVTSFVAARDGWTAGHYFAEFARLGLSRNDVDVASVFRVQLRNTARNILSSGRPEGYLSSDWSGTELNFNTGNSTWSEESASGYGAAPGGGIAAPDQIMTHSGALTVVLAAAQVAAAGSGLAPAFAIEDLPSELTALWVALKSKMDRSGGRIDGIVTGPLNLDGPIDFENGCSVGVSNGGFYFSGGGETWVVIDPTTPAIAHAISGVQITRADANGFAVFGRQINSGSYLYGVDNAADLGSSSLRARNIYAASGAIATSDEREKTWRGAASANELAAAKDIAAAIGLYQWDAAIAEKGADKARLHVGVKAQQVVSIMQAHGLDPMRYGFVCYDEWPAAPALLDEHGAELRPPLAAGDRYGIRADELALFLIAAHEQRLLALESK